MTTLNWTRLVNEDDDDFMATLPGVAYLIRRMVPHKTVEQSTLFTARVTMASGYERTILEEVGGKTALHTLERAKELCESYEQRRRLVDKALKGE